MTNGPVPNLISKATGVDYTKLRDLLAEKKWKEADRETATMMLKAAGQVEKKWLRKENIDKFPREDWQIIDGLWVHYSGRRFGFSVQKEIYQSLSGTGEEIWEKFGDKVGWREHGKWKKYDDIYRAAEKGHLPMKVWSNSDFSDASSGPSADAWLALNFSGLECCWLLKHFLTGG